MSRTLPVSGRKGPDRTHTSRARGFYRGTVIAPINRRPLKDSSKDLASFAFFLLDTLVNGPLIPPVPEERPNVSW